MLFTRKEVKNQKLKKERGICFDDIIIEWKLIDDTEHFNKNAYPNQRLMFIEYKKYIYYIPYKDNGEKIELITIIPSRKYTEIYLSNQQNNDKKK